MIEAIAEIAEAAQEVAINMEECRISAGIIDDMRELLNSVAKDIGEAKDSLTAWSEVEQSEAGFAESGDIKLDANTEYVKDGHLYETDENGEIYKKDGEFQTSYNDRLGRTPLEGERGKWTGERGESKYIPSTETERGARAAEKLAEYGIDGIEYKDAIPDFSDCAEESVQIEMTKDRLSSPADGIVGNFEKADTECAKKWNSELKDGRNDWKPRDVAYYRETHKMSWHECPDQKTCQLVSQDIHGYFGHSGGVSECKRSVVQDVIGGGFDV